MFLSKKKGLNTQVKKYKVTFKIKRKHEMCPEDKYKVEYYQRQKK